MTAHLPRLNRYVLTVFLIVGVPVLALGILLVLALAQIKLRDSYGAHLGRLAEQTTSTVDAYVYRKLLDVTLLARSPTLREAAAAASASRVSAEETRTIDARWQQRGELPPALAGRLATPASRFLADITSHDQLYRELLLTDRAGRLAAASNRTSDFDQSDEGWWRVTVDDGPRGRAQVFDVRWDASAGSQALEIAVPVAGPDSDDLAGVLKAVVDARELLALVGSSQPGSDGQAMLLRADGSIIFSRATFTPQARFFAAREMRAQLTRAEENPAVTVAHFDATSPDGVDQVVAVAASQLPRSYANLPWVVAVSQPAEELLTPIRSLGFYLLLVFALTALMVLVLALWFSVRLAAPLVETGMHLVDYPRVARMPDSDSGVEWDAPQAR
ncbi:MAG: cache domain-containing protein [Vicinamibacteraceae bacterium]